MGSDLAVLGAWASRRGSTRVASRDVPPSAESVFTANRTRIEQHRDQLAAERDGATGEHRARLQRQIGALEQLLAPGRQILHFDPSGEGQVAEVFGDLDGAERVAVVVPGMGSTLANFRRVSDDAERLHREASRRADGVATVAWLGYDAPDAVPSTEAATDALARVGAAALATTVAGIRARVGQGAEVTVIGHSYGSLVTGIARRDHQLDADDLVFLGSPGVGVDHADDLRGGEELGVWSARATFDPVSYLERFGEDPADLSFGAAEMETGTVTGHSSYFERGSGSMRNLARVVSGEHERVELAPIPLHERALAVSEDIEDLAGRLHTGAQQGADEVQRWVPLAPPLWLAIEGGQVVTGLAAEGADLTLDVGQEVLDRAGDLGGDVVEGVGQAGGAALSAAADGAGWFRDRLPI